jgi:hypothetical protein
MSTTDEKHHPLVAGPDRQADQTAQEPPRAPLLRDPPPPPGYTNPVEESDVLEDPFSASP